MEKPEPDLSGGIRPIEVDLDSAAADDEMLYDEAESKKREVDDRRSFVRRTIREGGRSVWATLARASENLTSAMGSMRDARDDLSAGLCTDGGLGAWASWTLVAVLLSGSAASTCLVSAFPASDLAVFGVMALAVAVVIVLPYGVHGFAGWSSFDTWPAAVVVCAWNAYGIAIAAHWESGREAVDWESDGGYSPVLGVLAVCCVAAMHSRLVYASRARTRAVAVAYATFVVASPSVDSVTPAMGTWLALLKVGAFFAIYVTCSFSLVSSDACARTTSKHKTKKKDDNNSLSPSVAATKDGYASRDRLLVQASWVLFTWRFLLVLAVVQLVVYVIHIVANLIKANAGAIPPTPSRSNRKQDWDIEEGPAEIVEDGETGPEPERSEYRSNGSFSRHPVQPADAMALVATPPPRFTAAVSPVSMVHPRSHTPVAARRSYTPARYQSSAAQGLEYGTRRRTEPAAWDLRYARDTARSQTTPAALYREPVNRHPAEDEEKEPTEDSEYLTTPPPLPPRDDVDSPGPLPMEARFPSSGSEHQAMPRGAPVHEPTRERTRTPRASRGILVPFVGRGNNEMNNE